jgi:uncharacterized protein (TIGR02996 family)
MTFADSYDRALKYGADYTHSDFHQKLLSNPKDSTTGLVYADWLEEQDKPTIANIVRRHAAVYHEGTYHPNYHDSHLPLLPHEFSGGIYQGSKHVDGEPSVFFSVDQRAENDKQLSWLGDNVKLSEAPDTIARLQAEGVNLRDFSGKKLLKDHTGE